MNFLHDDPEFDALLQIVAQARSLGVALVEKDYWVTHTLWALQTQGFEVWFKGGTSLSKGFGLIERFSEDLDLKLEHASLPVVTNWKSEGTTATAARRKYFEALARLLQVRGASTRPGETNDDTFRSANLHVDYVGTHQQTLPAAMRHFVLLEVGNARVTPFVERDMSSFVHDQLANTGQLEAYVDNRPRAVRCVHPLVTLLEKLDALMRRLPRHDVAAATFVRHFEDAANIVLAESRLPPLDGYVDVKALAKDLLKGQIKRLPTVTDEAFTPLDNTRWSDVLQAHRDIAPMFWGPRRSIAACCELIRSWLSTRLDSGS